MLQFTTADDCSRYQQANAIHKANLSEIDQIDRKVYWRLRQDAINQNEWLWWQAQILNIANR